MAGSLPVPPESNLAMATARPQGGATGPEPQQEAGDRGEPVGEAHGHQELFFEKYKVFLEKKKKEKSLYIKISSHIKS